MTEEELLELEREELLERVSAECARRLRAERTATVEQVAAAVAPEFGLTTLEAHAAFLARMERELEAAAV
jgi:hypothetical protein